MSTEILSVAAFAAGTEMSSPIQLGRGEPRSVAAHFNWSAALTATLVVEVSNDPALHGIVAAGGDPDTAEWIDYSAEVTMISPPAGGAERNGGANMTFFGYEWLRVGLAHGSGTADVVAWSHGIK